jgi:hypothetical protein
MAILESRTKTGISWVGESIVLFKQAPRKWLLLALIYLGVFVFIPSFPSLQLFAFITILIWPIFIAIAMRLYRNEEFQKQESLSSMMQLIQPKVHKLLLLGLINLLYFILVSMLLSSDVQVMVDIMETQSTMTNQEVMLAWQTMMPILLKLTVLCIPLMMAVWFAPMLITFNDYSVMKSIKSSVAGSLQYVVAMTAAWLLLSVGIIALMLAASVFAGLFAFMHMAFAQSLMTLLVFGALLISIALTLAFQYVSYRDIFRAAPNA